MKTINMRTIWLAMFVIVCFWAGCFGAGYSVVIQSAPRVEFPGVIKKGMDPNAVGEVDCSSPAHWDYGTMYMFYSIGHPFRSSGSDLFHLSRPSQRVKFNNEEEWTMGGRWIESTHKAGDGLLYMWYHNEPPLVTGRTAPRIGAMGSKDDGQSWEDFGIILEAPEGSNNLGSVNKYFVGGNGDFCVIADTKKGYVYFFISTYHKDKEEQGIAVARMRYGLRNSPKRRVVKWYQGRWREPGLGGHVTPIFPAAIDWHEPNADAFWGPSVHWNTYLKVWVMLLNRAKDKDWTQEGIYVSFNPDLAEPNDWTKPVKILDANELEKSKWYPQVMGTDVEKHETDKLAGQKARLFVSGLSKWEIVFLKPDEKVEEKELQK